MGVNQAETRKKQRLRKGTCLREISLSRSGWILRGGGLCAIEFDQIGVGEVGEFRRVAKPSQMASVVRAVVDHMVRDLADGLHEKGFAARIASVSDGVADLNEINPGFVHAMGFGDEVVADLGSGVFFAQADGHPGSLGVERVLVNLFSLGGIGHGVEDFCPLKVCPKVVF